MRFNFYKISGVFLLLLSLFSLISFLLIPFLLNLIQSTFLDFVSFLFLISLHPYVVPVTLFLGVTYYLFGFKKNKTNKKILTSAKLSFASLASFVLVLLGFLPCLLLPPDGLCMLFAIPFVLLNYVLWGISAIVLVVGLIGLKSKK